MCYLSDDQSNWNELLWISHVKLSQLSRCAVSPLFSYGRDGPDDFFNTVIYSLHSAPTKSLSCMPYSPPKKKGSQYSFTESFVNLAMDKTSQRNWLVVKPGHDFYHISKNLQFNTYKVKKWNPKYGGLQTCGTHCQRNIVVADSIGIPPKHEKWKHNFMWVQRGSTKGEYKGNGCREQPCSHAFPPFASVGGRVQHWSDPEGFPCCFLGMAGYQAYLLSKRPKTSYSIKTYMTTETWSVKEQKSK